MKAIILCGGKGTRLGELTEGKQKCMLDVGGKPFLRYIVDNTKKNLTDDIVLCGNGRDSKELELEFNDEVWYSYDSDDGTQMDAIKKVSRKIDNDHSVILNGDTFFAEFPHVYSSLSNYQCIDIYVQTISKGKMGHIGMYAFNPKEISRTDGVAKTIDSFSWIGAVRHCYLRFFVDIGTPKGLQDARNNVEVIKNAIYGN